ncbi:hypothetical protein C8N36_103258 [Pelagimonas varians]|uniref:Uncharacterized protein n=1 Tax=Pelagimonas varians TaxID=696760 RepID=A0A238KUA5_9RHOB|nr:hypothetical protein C8N36_103258 [Pelagimonas varians]SMX45742.1 hypothetical protein PEV8663_03102 [Pelagimonas varians]
MDSLQDGFGGLFVGERPGWAFPFLADSSAVSRDP